MEGSSAKANDAKSKIATVIIFFRVHLSFQPNAKVSTKQASYYPLSSTSGNCGVCSTVLVGAGFGQLLQDWFRPS